MDPVAHTLVGAALAETGLKKLSRHATATLLIGANLPDVDVVANLWGSDAALYFRRGWTHGVLALAILPLLLAAGVWLWHRWRGHRNPSGPPLRMGAIVVLSFLAVWSHPLLDWLNTYGIRLLMPLDDRWFYGDTLFIVDPWMWLLAAAGVVLARSGSYSAIAGWIALAAVTTGVVVLTGVAALTVKIVWLFGLAVIVVLRWLKPASAFRLLVTRLSFAALTLYTCMAYGLARVAESTVVAAHPTPSEVQANPVPGQPATHRMVMVYDDHYQVIMPDGDIIKVPRQKPNEIVLTAMKEDEVKGFVNWMRYPYWQVEETRHSWIVTFRDLRYLNPGEPSVGIGLARVEVPKQR